MKDTHTHRHTDMPKLSIKQIAFNILTDIMYIGVPTAVYTLIAHFILPI